MSAHEFVVSHKHLWLRIVGEKRVFSKVYSLEIGYFKYIHIYSFTKHRLKQDNDVYEPPL